MEAEGMEAERAEAATAVGMEAERAEAVGMEAERA